MSNIIQTVLLILFSNYLQNSNDLCFLSDIAYSSSKSEVIKVKKEKDEYIKKLIYFSDIAYSTAKRDAEHNINDSIPYINNK